MTAVGQEQARPVKITPRIGASFSSITNRSFTYTVSVSDKEFTSEPSTKIGLVAGADVEFPVDEKLGASVGLQYAMMGCKQDDVPTLSNLNVTLDYLQLPLLLRYYLTSDLSVCAGIQPAYLLHAAHVNKCKDFSCSVPVGIAYEYNRFVVDVRYQFGLTKLYDKTDGTADTKNKAFMVTLGYRFDL